MAELRSLNPRGVYPDRQIYLDYLAGAEKLAPFYGHYPAEKQTLLNRADEVSTQANHSVPLAKALLEYNQRISAGPAALKNAQLLAKPQTLAVVTGQQAGFAGGPLYNVYKAATAVKLAEHLAKATAKPVVPIFWVASEDCSINEIDHTAWIDKQGQLRCIRCDLHDSRRQISSLHVSQSALDAFGQLTEFLPDSEFSEKFLQLYRPRLDESWSTWFARIYAGLFAEQGLVMLEPHVVYPFAGTFFSRAVSRLSALQQSFDEQTSRLNALGYQPQIAADRRAILYLIENGRRKGILPQDGHFLVDSFGQYSSSELADLAADHPERFSCSVMLRPLAQDFLLPTVACVAGPGEVAYYAQFVGLYEQLDLSMPVIWPRVSMTLIEPNITRIISKSSLTVEQLLDSSEPPEPSADLSAEKPGAQALQRLASQTKTDLAKLIEELSSKDGSLEKLSAKVSRRIERDIDRLLQRGLQSLDHHNQITQRQRQRARTSLQPRNQPQERIFPLLGYLVYYGQAVLEQIRNRIDIFDFNHQLLHLDFSSKQSKQSIVE